MHTLSTAESYQISAGSITPWTITAILGAANVYMLSGGCETLAPLSIADCNTYAMMSLLTGEALVGITLFVSDFMIETAPLFLVDNALC